MATTVKGRLDLLSSVASHLVFFSFVYTSKLKETYRKNSKAVHNEKHVVNFQRLIKVNELP